MSVQFSAASPPFRPLPEGVAYAAKWATLACSGHQRNRVRQEPILRSGHAGLPRLPAIRRHRQRRQLASQGGNLLMSSCAPSKPLLHGRHHPVITIINGSTTSRWAASCSSRSTTRNAFPSFRSSPYPSPAATKRHRRAPRRQRYTLSTGARRQEPDRTGRAGARLVPHSSCPLQRLERSDPRSASRLAS